MEHVRPGMLLCEVPCHTPEQWRTKERFAEPALKQDGCSVLVCMCFRCPALKLPQVLGYGGKHSAGKRAPASLDPTLTSCSAQQEITCACMSHVQESACLPERMPYAGRGASACPAPVPRRRLSACSGSTAKLKRHPPCPNRSLELQQAAVSPVHRFGGGWGAARGPEPEPGPAPEDADAYAQRLWEEMQRRQRARSGAASVAAQATWGAADAAARARDGRRGDHITRQAP